MVRGYVSPVRRADGSSDVDAVRMSISRDQAKAFVHSRVYCSVYHIFVRSPMEGVKSVPYFFSFLPQGSA